MQCAETMTLCAPAVGTLPVKFLPEPEFGCWPIISGQYDINGMTLIVSRGTGTWGPRMRLWAGGEISLITLRAPVPARKVKTNAGKKTDFKA
jgi:hypothetical protein